MYPRNPRQGDTIIHTGTHQHMVYDGEDWLVLEDSATSFASPEPAFVATEYFTSECNRYGFHYEVRDDVRYELFVSIDGVSRGIGFIMMASLYKPDAKTNIDRLLLNIWENVQNMIKAHVASND